MSTRTLSKGEKLNWKPLSTVVSVKISAKNLKGRKVVASAVSPKRVVH
ncbi:hypothetical protein QGN23_00615 [Chryseobacterium gotjawalense]|uniref:Uncharacterized protein n=1 Tax=Chryseobacterium gotjawalense TaxID=3042315 RepID=A0ABY8RD58_9FLAO|nr:MULTISPECIES: hypothetical protein [unclassified Chryseobacterium]MDQ0477087.1 hypothetical protein [Chryseobacterium sp. MDT2-18]WHF51796.1 hypothetical protein QGN23_00615 [Chryseobacterium sp. wdc7]